MKTFDDVNHANNLPDAYAKKPDSNNYKILLIEQAAVGALMVDIEAVNSVLDMDDATGETLDKYGEMLNQPRGLATDEQYRLMLRSKIAQNLSKGDYNSVISALALTFGCEPSAFALENSVDDAGEEIPGQITVSRLPFDVIAKAGLSAAQSIKIINRLMPVGVQVETVEFEGTFELCGTEADMGADGASKGLTDTEEHMDIALYPNAVGGYLGEIYNGEDADLPI